MRAAFLCLIFFVGVVLSAVGAPKFTVPPTPLQAKPGDLQAFYGQVKAVNRSERTVTIALGMRFTFHVPPETQITIRGKGAAGYDAIHLGQGAQIIARRGANSWTAHKIVLEPGATFADEVSAKTATGKTITGPAVGEFVVYEPPTEVINRNINFGNRSGLFLLSVGPDGAVVSVHPIKSLGVTELDQRAIQRLRKMRFRPGTLTEVRVPVSFNSIRRY